MIDLLERFKAYKVGIEGKHKKSIEQYIYRIKDFLDMYNIKDNESLVSITAQDVENWLLRLNEEGNGAATRNAKLTAIKTIYSFIKRYKRLNKLNIKDIDEEILMIKNAKTPIREQKYMDGETARYFIKNITNLRTKAGAAITFATGVRFCELITITTEDINRGFADIIGKGNKERKIYFPTWCLQIVNKYIDEKRNHILERTGVKTNKLFISDEGNIMNSVHYNESLKHYAKKCGIEWFSQLSSHKLRHSFASNMLFKNYDVVTVRDALGHNSIATTNRYSHSKTERVRDMMMGEDSFEKNN